MRSIKSALTLLSTSSSNPDYAAWNHRIGGGHFLLFAGLGAEFVVDDADDSFGRIDRKGLAAARRGCPQGSRRGGGGGTKFLGFRGWLRRGLIRPTRGDARSGL